MVCVAWAPTKDAPTPTDSAQMCKYKSPFNRYLRPTGNAGLSPELRIGRMELAAFVAQPVRPIFLQKQGAVQIDETGLLRQ